MGAQQWKTYMAYPRRWGKIGCLLAGNICTDSQAMRPIGHAMLGRSHPETYIKRHLSVQLTGWQGQMKWEKIFCIRPTRTANAGQNYLVPARRAQWTTKEGPLSYVLLLSSSLPQFQQLAWATPLYCILSLWSHLPSYKYPSPVNGNWIHCQELLSCNIK